MSVGPFSVAARLIMAQSNSDTLLRRFVVVVRSVVLIPFTSSPDRAATTVHAISLAVPIGPEVPPGGLWTRMGNVRHTMTTRRTRDGAMPASAAHPLAVVSLDVT